MLFPTEDPGPWRRDVSSASVSVVGDMLVRRSSDYYVVGGMRPRSITGAS